MKINWILTCSINKAYGKKVVSQNISSVIFFLFLELFESISAAPSLSLPTTADKSLPSQSLRLQPTQWPPLWSSLLPLRWSSRSASLFMSQSPSQSVLQLLPSSPSHPLFHLLSQSHFPSLLQSPSQLPFNRLPSLLHSCLHCQRHIRRLSCTRYLLGHQLPRRPFCYYRRQHCTGRISQLQKHLHHPNPWSYVPLHRHLCGHYPRHCFRCHNHRPCRCPSHLLYSHSLSCSRCSQLFTCLRPRSCHHSHCCHRYHHRRSSRKWFKSWCVILFLYFALFCFFTFSILILYNYNCYFPYLRRQNMFLNLAEWISTTPVPCRYFILLISIRSYATDVPVNVFWMFKRNLETWIFIKRITHFLFVC